MTGFVLVFEGKNDRKVLRGGGAWRGKAKVLNFFKEVKVQRSLSCDDWLSY